MGSIPIRVTTKRVCKRYRLHTRFSRLPGEMKTSGSSVGKKKNLYFKHRAKREMSSNLPAEKDFCERMKYPSPGLGKADAGG